MRLAKSTNKLDFMSFLVDIKQSVLPRYRSSMQILLYDGARAHTCNDSQDFIEGYFKPLQIPVMSCEFNCKSNFLKPLLNSNITQNLNYTHQPSTQISPKTWIFPYFYQLLGFSQTGFELPFLWNLLTCFFEKDAPLKVRRLNE